jgi:broad specificity phosphatase PhoE
MVMRTVDLFRHTDNDEDQLTPEGVEAAERVGRELLTPPYDAYVSSGAARATQMLEILRRAAGQEDQPITAEPGMRSFVEDRWRDVAKAAGTGADLEAIRDRDPDLVDKEAWMLGRGLKRVIEHLPDGGRALVVGHSPTNEAAVLGLTGAVVAPLGKGEGVTVVERDGKYTVTAIGHPS